MKKFLAVILSIVSIFCCGLLTACGETPNLVFVPLQNNTTGFVTSEGDTAIAVGVKKGNVGLLNDINAYLSTLEANDWSALMGEMVALQNDSEATYEPEYDNSNTSNGTFKVAMECAYAPFNWTQNDNSNGAVPIANVAGKYVNGYDVQIAAQIAASMNKELVVNMVEWDSLIPGVQAGTYDAIIAGMSPTDERKTEIDFSVNYYQSNLVVITREGSRIADFTTLAELDIEGVKIAAQPGTFHLIALEEQTENLEVVMNLATFVDMKIALETGVIDGYIAEEPTAMTYCVGE